MLLESQYLEKYIISTNCPTGPKEILLNGKLGDLFPVKNYSILSHRLYNFSKNSKPLKNKSKKAKKYLKRFNPIINSKKYFELLFAK